MVIKIESRDRKDSAAGKTFALHASWPEFGPQLPKQSPEPTEVSSEHHCMWTEKEKSNG